MPPTLTVKVGSGLSFAWAFETETESPGDALAEYDNTQITEVMWVNWADREKVPEEVLGYAFRAAAALKRVLPMKHPDSYWLWATAASGRKGVDFLSTKEDRGRGEFPAYRYAKYTVRYGTLPYAVTADGAGAEYLRFVEKKIKPVSEILSSDRAQYKFDDAGTANTAFIKGAVGLPVGKATIEWTWHNVPENYLFSGGLASKIMTRLNYVNDAAFDGYPAGTLLLDSVDFEPVSAPVSPQKLGLDLFQPARMFRVRFVFKYFDPPTTGAFRGHNLAPDPTSAAGNWYRIRTAAGRTKFLSTDFTELFKGV